jgi:uncharacterized protein (TIGR02391 family)
MNRNRPPKLGPIIDRHFYIKAWRTKTQRELYCGLRGTMAKPRSEALDRLVSDLETFKIELNQYYDDLEPQGVYDRVLTGKLDALAGFCSTLGWSELSVHLKALLPFQGSAVEGMEQVQGFILPEIRQLLEKTDIDSAPCPTDWFWQLIHPRIKTLARPRFDAGFFGDAVETSFKEVNDAVKLIFKDKVGKELDGAGLMTTALSPTAPVIKISPMITESDRNMQQGYMQIFAGAMTGIRNPKAHGNLNPDSRNALHLIGLASLLMYRIDERC